MRAKRLPSTLGKILLALLPLAGAMGLPYYFVYSDVISGALAQVLRLEPEPAISGGRVLARYADPLGDDKGAGELEPPLAPAFGEGELDLVSYTVRKPLPRSAWSEGKVFWQLEARFACAVSTGMAGGGFRAPVLHIYIDMDGAVSGSVESAFGEGELVRFDPKAPWDYAISADGHAPAAEIRSADGTYRDAVEQTWDAEHGRLILRVDLMRAPPLLESVLAGGDTAHYVMVGAYDGARDGGFAALRDFPNLHAGGGARDELTPRVYDLLALGGESQAAMLASEDAALGRLALVEPVRVQGTPGDSPKTEADTAIRARLEAEVRRAEEEEELARNARAAALPPSNPATDAAILGELFELGMEERARAAAQDALTKDMDNPLALAYRGTLTALRADRAQGLTEKMGLVEEAYRDLDAAVIAATKPGANLPAQEVLSILLCRANVSAAVPDAVFGRAAQGGADFDEAARMAAGDLRLEASCLAGAAQAYEKAGREEDAMIRWATLAIRKELPAAIRLELLDRSIETQE